jgi:hypothetical protein
MGRILKLSREGFRGKVTVNFDGAGPKDIIEQRYENLAQMESDPEVDDLLKMGKRIKNI